MEFYKVQVKKSLPFFKEIIEKFCCNSRIRLEGNLTKVDFSPLVSSFNPLFPEHSNIADFIIFPLTQANKNILLELLPRIGIRKNIYQIHIEQNGCIVYVSNDSFDKEMVFVTATVGEDFIKNLLANGILWRYEITEFADSDEKSFTKQMFG